ncbi:glycoside hydrolase [Tothia fuscella]|uniref:glucan endo-1,3-beta-D-glucosidase n=1 Tax=Tothia fuscella TaxID=1048955 RepID=A0A9P4TWW6_9PEZI|nr:glycoside hydrolase [Tothia fuscella]
MFKLLRQTWKINVTSQTTAKGTATGVIADKWTMDDQLPTFGKALANFAAVVYVTNDLTKNTGLAAAGLVKLKAAMQTFVQKKQSYPLAYDTVWGGIVSTAGYTDTGADFWDTNYNDHHFHYGYFVYAAAVIAHIDPSWLTINSGSNKIWVNALVRDYANSISDDLYLYSRNFNWFHGHSWAKGLLDSGVGKDQESRSEDSFASYAIKMLGKSIRDSNMEARGNLMLAIQGRSFQNYFLMESTHTVQPFRFINNKVTGILFESKIDHTTYFGINIEHIEGSHFTDIHSINMIPIMPNSGLIRKANFVKEEWAKYFDNGRVNAVQAGWKGILYANLAFIDVTSSWNFFASSFFDPGNLDGGASRTWYLTLAAALGGMVSAYDFLGANVKGVLGFFWIYNCVAAQTEDVID